MFSLYIWHSLLYNEIFNYIYLFIFSFYIHSICLTCLPSCPAIKLFHSLLVESRNISLYLIWRINLSYWMALLRDGLRGIHISCLELVERRGEEEADWRPQYFAWRLVASGESPNFYYVGVLQRARAPKFLTWLKQVPLRTPTDHNSVTQILEGS